MRVAILQSNYIPWKGYFDIIKKVDLFVFLDNVQYTRRDWRNRNLIKTRQGLSYLSIPIGNCDHLNICDVEILDCKWQLKHYNFIYENYHKASFYNYVKDFLDDIYIKNQWRNLSQLNQYIIKVITHDFLKINVDFIDAKSFEVIGKKQERIINLLELVKAKTYVCGPAAKTYINEEDFNNRNIQLEWMEYKYKQTYPQLFPPFEHKVSIIDLLMNTGPSAINFMLPDT